MEFINVVEKRKSIRKYDVDKKVTAEQVNEIIEACRLAPSWKNGQPSRYYVVLSDEEVAKVSAEVLPEFNQNNSKGAALIVTTFVQGLSGFGADPETPANELGNTWGAYDLGISNAIFTLKAAEMGLGTLIMGIRDADKARELLSIPENETIVAVIALGYPAVDPDPRPRKAAEEISKIF